MQQQKIHTCFKLNGKSFTSKETLLAFSKTINNSIFLFLANWFDNNDFVVVQTSGSTGKPKPIQLQKEFMINSAKATGTFFNLHENTSVLLCLSTDYIAGKMMLVRALTLGWCIDVVNSSSEVVINKEYDFSAMVPLQLRASLQHVHKIKKLIVGGGVVSADLIEKIQGISTQVFATYGMTETITHIAVKKLNNIATNDNNKSFYKALPNVQLLQDNRACLVINAPKVASENIITNDVVQLLSKTEFEWLGRYDNVINSGGIKLHPEKIEEKLSTIIHHRFFVTGISDARLGEKLVLLIEAKKSETLIKAVQNFKELTKYEVPKEIYFVDVFVETETKKIQRKKTMDLLSFD